MPTIENFEIFITNLIKNDESTWSVASEHIEIILGNWCRKNKLELEWIADEEGVCNTSKQLEIICVLLREELMKRSHDSITFADYKKILILIAEKEINERFKKFYHLLELKNDQAWKYVDRRLRIYVVKWFSNRNYQKPPYIPDIYSDSLEIMLEKICGKTLFFKNSRMLKSYFFSILENKTKESVRNNKFTIDTVVDVLEGVCVMETNEYDDTYLFVKKAMKRLTSNEQYILTAFYMHDKNLLHISKELHLSYENCRVVKHRAIKKLMDAVKIH